MFPCDSPSECGYKPRQIAAGRLGKRPDFKAPIKQAVSFHLFFIRYKLAGLQGHPKVRPAHQVQMKRASR